MIVLEKTLQKQLSHAILSMYLKSFSNIHINTISISVPIILVILIKNYGRVTGEKLQENENNLKTKIFDIINPLIIMYNKIKELHQLATAVLLLYTTAQIINIEIKLVKNTNDFEKGLSDWYDKSAKDHTWLNFKEHFTTAQDILLISCYRY